MVKILTRKQRSTVPGESQELNRSRENRCPTTITSMLNAGVGLVREFEEPAAVIMKHNNPCGVATGAEIFDAYITARDVDPVSAYGSVVSVNRVVDEKLAAEISNTFVEVIVAPAFSPDALEIMKKKENMRVLVLPEKSGSDEIRTIDGGVLVQRTPEYQEHWEVITDRDPTPDEMKALATGMESL